MIAIDLSKDDQAGNSTILIIIEKAKEVIFDFSRGTVRVF